MKVARLPERGIHAYAEGTSWLLHSSTLEATSAKESPEG